jgi:hypothetical protein
MKSKTNKGLSNGDHIKILWLPNNRGVKNAYIGFEGIVKIEPYNRFSLFSGKSWLVNIGIDRVKYEFIKKQNGLFKINNVEYYSEESVIHKPVKCCKCGFIPVEYIISGIFFPKYYCSNCKK